jgi:hypothetical protein
VGSRRRWEVAWQLRDRDKREMLVGKRGHRAMDGDWGGARVRQGADGEKPRVAAVSAWMRGEQEGDGVATSQHGWGRGGLLSAADRVDPDSVGGRPSVGSGGRWESMCRCDATVRANRGGGGVGDSGCSGQEPKRQGRETLSEVYIHGLGARATCQLLERV